MTQVAGWVHEIVAESHKGKRPLRVGDVVYLPDELRKVKITSGQYWGQYGLSNFWHWREILPNGGLSEIDEHGYGWLV